ncbi:MAG: glycoside hydrolase family 3 C-terminal domain-containing protein [Microbacterium sp.]
MTTEDIAGSAAELSVEDAVTLGSGASFWATVGLPGVPEVRLADGPHGVRRQRALSDHLGVGQSEPATCFPPMAGLAQSWDAEIIGRVGAALGVEAAAMGVHVLLGPGVNIKRDPRGGRNFEYVSEDPYLAGVLGTAWVRGLQGQGVAASLKHFALNNQETDRNRVSAEVDERALREIYLRVFERIIRDADPWTVMCSYNKINGEYAAENLPLLTGILREEWGFSGVVVSDWGAVHNRVESVDAGLDLQMPGPADADDRRLAEATETGEISPDTVRRSARRVARLARRIVRSVPDETPVDFDAHHALAREAAARSTVLLKNDGEVLPLATSDTPLAVIGEFARTPRYQGGGSSRVNARLVDAALPAIESVTGADSVRFAPGYTLDGLGDEQGLIAEAVHAARESHTALVFLGLPEEEESEGYDRPHISLPVGQLRLLREVCAVQPRTVVVLSHGGMVELSEVAKLAPALLDGALLGEAGGAATADVLFGVVNPSARLTETAPLRLEHAPSYFTFPGRFGRALYGEGIFVGYRGYDIRDQEVAFPFGHGLSYTRFVYADATIRTEGSGLALDVEVRNCGDRRGREVVQVYATLSESRVPRPVRWLVGFADVELDPACGARVRVPIDRDDLAYWDVGAHRFVVESGEYEFSVGASSRDLRQSVRFDVRGERVPVTVDSPIVELLAVDTVRPELERAILKKIPAGTTSAHAQADVMRMIGASPVESLAQFGVDHDRLAEWLRRANATEETTTSVAAPVPSRNP